jgi:hypothetical protein
MSLLLAYFGLALIVLLAVVGPLVVGRLLADHEGAIDSAERREIEAHALMLLAGPLD